MGPQYKVYVHTVRRLKLSSLHKHHLDGVKMTRQKFRQSLGFYCIILTPNPEGTNFERNTVQCKFAAKFWLEGRKGLGNLISVPAITLWVIDKCVERKTW